MHESQYVHGLNSFLSEISHYVDPCQISSRDWNYEDIKITTEAHEFGLQIILIDTSHYFIRKT
jgi:hypothetical protein